MSTNQTFRGRFVFLAALAVLFVVLGIRYSDKVLHDRGAIGRWRQQIQMMDEVDIADRFNYPNPPIMAVLLEPLTRLPPLAGDLVWFYLKVAMALVSLHLVFRLVETADRPLYPPPLAGPEDRLSPLGCPAPLAGPEDRLSPLGCPAPLAGPEDRLSPLGCPAPLAGPEDRLSPLRCPAPLAGPEDRLSPLTFPAWAKVLTILCSIKPIIDDLNHGNINLFILFLVVLVLTLYRQRYDLLAGGFLALAIACKITPALFIPYFVWKRAWRTLAGCVVGVGLFFYPGVVPALRLGVEKNQHQLSSWYRGMVKPFVIEGKVTSEHINQSLPGLVFRLATHSPSFVTFVDNIETPSRYDNWLSLSHTGAQLVVKGCMLLFVLLVVWSCRTPPGQRQGFAVAAEMGIVVLGMLLFSERTWKHHCVTLMLPFAVLCYRLALPCPAVLRRSLIVVLVLVVGLTTLTGLGPARERALAGASPGFAKLALVYGAYTWAFLALLAGLVLVLRSREQLAGANLPGRNVPLTEPVAPGAAA